jgi:hypothetical protein
MITYTRTDNGWTGTDRSKADLTDYKRLRELPPEERRAAFDAIREQTTVAVDNEAELEALYDLHRPEVPEGVTYQLIAMDVVNGSGILNCRVNGEHVQVRF